MRRLFLALAALIGFGAFAAPAMAGGPWCRPYVRPAPCVTYRHLEHCVPAPVVTQWDYNCHPAWHARYHCGVRHWHRR
jgi:hypothetical protein